MLCVVFENTFFTLKRSFFLGLKKGQKKIVDFRFFYFKNCHIFVLYYLVTVVRER